MNENAQLIAQVLALFYTGTAESKAEKILSVLSKITGIPSITLSAMRKTLFACSCLCDYIQKVVCCPSCGKWQLTTNVFCPKCSANATTQTDWSSIQLFECNGVKCEGNPTQFSKYRVFEKQKAVCLHKSKKLLCKYVFFVPPEAIIAEYFRSKLYQSMVCLEEKEICDALQQADRLGYHSVLFSRNAAIIYHDIGWRDAERAVLDHLAKNDGIDPCATLSGVIDEASHIHHPFSCLLLI